MPEQITILKDISANRDILKRLQLGLSSFPVVELEMVAGLEVYTDH